MSKVNDIDYAILKTIEAHPDFKDYTTKIILQCVYTEEEKMDRPK